METGNAWRAHSKNAFQTFESTRTRMNLIFEYHEDNYHLAGPVKECLLLRFLAFLLFKAHLSFILHKLSVCDSPELSSDNPRLLKFSALDDLLIRAVSACKSFIIISVVFVVIPLTYQEMGGGGTRAGCISCSKLTFDPILPFPFVHET